MKNIVILISGGGSNMAALVRAAEREQWAKRYDARVALVISNKADAKGLDFARAQGIATAVLDHKAYASRDVFDAALAELISQSDTPGQPALVVLAGFMRILTPAFVERFGPILEQAVVPVLPDDTADPLAARVLTQEHLSYPRAIARLLQGS